MKKPNDLMICEHLKILFLLENYFLEILKFDNPNKINFF